MKTGQEKPGNKYWWWSTTALVLAGLFLVWSKNSNETKTNKSADYFNGEINQIKIGFPKQAKENIIAKEGNGWVVKEADGEVPADAEMVERAVEELKEIRLEDPVSVNKEKFGNFGLSDDEKVVIETGGKRLEVGKMTEMMDGTYVKGDEDKVYKIDGILEFARVSDQSYWYQKKIKTVEPEKIKAIVVGGFGKSKEFRKKEDGGWENQGLADKVTNLPVDRLLKNFSPSKNSKIYKLEILTEEKKYVLELGRETKGKETTDWIKDEKGKYWQINGEDFNLLTGVLN